MKAIMLALLVMVFSTGATASDRTALCKAEAELAQIVTRARDTGVDIIQIKDTVYNITKDSSEATLKALVIIDIVYQNPGITQAAIVAGVYQNCMGRE
jgi:hypothetical protein